ncbi:MAG: hypothetical protein U1F70_00580 [Candidatus Competibacteraceae bacterium]
MAISYSVLATLSEPAVKEVLNTIANETSVGLGQLVSDDIDQAQALQAIETLKQAELIKETDAPIDSLKTFYVTALGLQANRLFRG